MTDYLGYNHKKSCGREIPFGHFVLSQWLGITRARGLTRLFLSSLNLSCVFLKVSLEIGVRNGMASCSAPSKIAQSIFVGEVQGHSCDWLKITYSGGLPVCQSNVIALLGGGRLLSWQVMGANLQTTSQAGLVGLHLISGCRLTQTALLGDPQ